MKNGSIKSFILLLTSKTNIPKKNQISKTLWRLLWVILFRDHICYSGPYSLSLCLVWDLGG